MVDVTSLINKADVLNEALPFIQEFKDSIAVVKFGGSAMENPELTKKTMRDIVLLEAIGMKNEEIDGALRIGLSRFTTEDDIQALVSGLIDARRSLAHR